MNLTSTQAKVDMINRGWDGHEQPLYVGSAAMIILYSDEWIQVENADPVVLILKTKETSKRLSEIEPGTFVYESERYPIRVWIEIVRVVRDERGSQVWIQARAEVTE